MHPLIFIFTCTLFTIILLVLLLEYINIYLISTCLCSYGQAHISYILKWQDVEGSNEDFQICNSNEVGIVIL